MVRLAPLASMLALTCACTEPPSCAVDPGAEDGRRGNSTCLVEDGARLLLVRQRFSGKLGLPGGRRRRGETGQCTAHRETWEETGYEVVVGPLLARPGGTMIFSCRLRTGDAGTSTSRAHRPWASYLEVSDHEWVEPDALGSIDWRFPDHGAKIREILESRNAPSD